MTGTSSRASAPPDEALVDQARAGDSAAREELFRRSRDVAFRVAFRLLGHEDDAMDAVQDAFLKAFLHLNDFDKRSEFRTWLLRIVTNAARDVGRKKRRRPWVSLTTDDGEASGDGPATPSVEEDPGLGIHRADLRKQIQQALDRLSDSTRTTFVLFAEAGLSYKEIAECQGVPIGTVMSRLHFARQKLQADLREIESP